MGGRKLVDVVEKWLDWLDRQPGVKFWVVLYLVRWPVIIPLGILQGFIASDVIGGGDGAAHMQAHWGLLVFPPMLETLIECVVPYWIFWRMKEVDGVRVWRFVLISAGLMAVLHYPYGMVCGFVTGMFLAYCYAHFAIRSQWKAFWVTALYHVGINAVGFAMLLM